MCEALEEQGGLYVIFFIENESDNPRRNEEKLILIKILLSAIGEAKVLTI